jgi:hypothetical protein
MLLLGLNAFFAYFILLKAFQKGYQWQLQYLVCSVVQVVIEMAVFETTECVWLNFAVPSLVRNEVAVAAEKLRAHVEMITASTATADALVKEPVTYFLNAPVHLFVSVKVAQAYPQLLESMLVRSYSNHLPGEICRTWPHYKQAAGAALVPVHTRQRRLPWFLVRGVTLAIQLFITIPYLYQRVAIRFLQPIIFSGLSTVWFAAVKTRTSTYIMSGAFAALIVYALWVWYTSQREALRTKTSVRPDMNPQVALQNDVPQGPVYEAVCAVPSPATHSGAVENEENSDPGDDNASEDVYNLENVSAPTESEEWYDSDEWGEQHESSRSDVSARSGGMSSQSQSSRRSVAQSVNSSQSSSNVSAESSVDDTGDELQE